MACVTVKKTTHVISIYMHNELISKYKHVMKKSHIIRFLVAVIMMISYFPNVIGQVKPAPATAIREVSAKDLPTPQKILEQGVIVKLEAQDWYMINMEAVAQKGGATPLNVPMIKGWGKIKVEKGGKMYLTDVNMNFKMNIPILEKGQTSIVASEARITSVSKEDFQMEGNKVSRFGLLEQDGWFNLPWIVKVKFDALPGQEFLACIQTWGFMGKAVLSDKENYADVGGLIGIKPLKPTKTSGKTLDLQKVNPVCGMEGKRAWCSITINNRNNVEKEKSRFMSLLRQRESRTAPSPYRDAVIKNMDAASTAIKAVHYPNQN